MEESNRLPTIFPSNTVKYRSIEQLRNVQKYMVEEDMMKLGPILSTQKKVVHVSSTFNNSRRLFSKSINENPLSSINNYNDNSAKSPKDSNKFTVVKLTKIKHKNEKNGEERKGTLKNKNTALPSPMEN